MADEKFLDLNGLTRYDNKIKEYIAENTEIIQYSTMPVASNENLNKIVQYTSGTNGQYTNGYFYKSVYKENIISELTEQAAIAGVNKFFVPTEFTLDTAQTEEAWTELRYDVNNLIYIGYMQASDVDTITVDIRKTGADSVYIKFISANGTDYQVDAEDESKTGYYTFDNNLTLNNTWYAFVGKALSQVAPGYVWERIDIQPGGDIDAYTKAETDALFAETDAQIDDLETAVGKLAFRGFYGGNSFDTNANEPGVYFVRTDSFSDGHGHSSTPTNYGFHPGTFFGVVYLLKKYDTAQAGDTLGYVVGTSSGINNNGWAACFKKISSGNYISYSGYGEPTSYTFLTTSTNQTGINGKKTFTTLPESSVVPTTNNQLVNKKYVDDSIASIPVSPSIQYSEIPEASVSTVGDIIQYIGPDDYNLHDLTQDEANNGFSKFILPETIHFDTDLPNDVSVSFVDDSNATKLIVRSLDDSGISSLVVYIAPAINYVAATYYKTDDDYHITASSVCGPVDMEDTVYLSGNWADFAGPVLQQALETPKYKNGCFYKGIYKPLIQLTDDVALAGIFKFTLPEYITLTGETPADGTEVTIEIDDHSEYVKVEYRTISSGFYQLFVNMKFNGVNSSRIYISIDNIHYRLENSQENPTRVYSFSEDAFLTSNWADFAGLVLLQDSDTPYAWEDISVQSGNGDMSNYYTKADIDAIMGDIGTILSTLTIPTQVEQELSEI